MMLSASYKTRRTFSSTSLKVARRAGIGVAAESLVVLELTATSRKARPPSPESGRVADKGVGGPPMMEARRAGALPTPWSNGVGNLMRRNERERWKPHEVQRTGTGVAASELVLEVLAAKRKVRLPRSEDGCAAQRGHRCLADDGGAVGDGVGCLETRRSRAAAGVVTPLRGPVNGFVEGNVANELLRADEVLTSPKDWWVNAAAGRWMKWPSTEWSTWRRVAVASRGKRRPWTVTSRHNR